MASTGCTVEQLFLNHITKVAKAIKEEWPHMSIVMWDDMMRGMSEDTLKGEEKILMSQKRMRFCTVYKEIYKSTSSVMEFSNHCY